MQHGRRDDEDVPGAGGPGCRERPLDLASEMKDLTGCVVARTMFGSDVGEACVACFEGKSDARIRGGVGP